MTEHDIDPLVRAVVEDRAHAINQMIMDARLAKAQFPGEHVRNVINLSVADNTVGYLCYFLATLVDAHFGQTVELKLGG
jgi:hypothetical protein